MAISACFAGIFFIVPQHPLADGRACAQIADFSPVLQRLKKVAAIQMNRQARTVRQFFHFIVCQSEELPGAADDTEYGVTRLGAVTVVLPVGYVLFGAPKQAVDFAQVDIVCPFVFPGVPSERFRKTCCQGNVTSAKPLVYILYIFHNQSPLWQCCICIITLISVCGNYFTAILNGAALHMANVNRSVNRTVTVPAWLNAAALERNINI